VVSTTVLLLPEFLQISLRMTRWSSRSTTFRRAFVHHVRGPYYWELLIDLEKEDTAARAVVFGLLREMERY
jgi:hypothetical protein